MAGGRPLIYETPELLEKAVSAYFAVNNRVTLSGLALHIGMSRQNLYNYAERDEFFDIIKKARERVEAHYEDIAIYEDKPTGVIFALKNMGWSDNIKNQHSGAVDTSPQFDITKLTDDELRTLAKLQRKGGVSEA